MHDTNAIDLESCDACLDIFTGHSGTTLEAFIDAHNAHFYGR